MKKLIIVILSICLLFSALAISAGASYRESLKFYDVITDMDDSISGSSLTMTGYDSKYYYKQSIGKQAYSSYQLLDACQKSMYNQIVTAAPGTLSITLKFDYGVFLASNFTQEYLTKAASAIWLDRTDLFYFAGYKISGGTYYSGSQYINTLNYQIIMFDNVTYTEADLPGFYEDLMDAVESVPVDLSNRYSFVKSVHDYLCTTAYYPDLTTSDYVDNAHDAYGALVEKRTVCQGYSEAMKLVCDYYKIPCVCISGTANGGGHMWNAVQMDDGKWYFLDITWDDQTFRIFYDFFLVGTDSLSANFGDGTFSETHVPTDSNVLPELYYANDAYTAQTHNTVFGATYNSYCDADNKYLVLSAVEAPGTTVYYNGIYVDTPNLSTNAEFQAPSGTNGEDEDWTLVLAGDCNADGSVTAEDYSYCINLVLSDEPISSAYDKAADLDCDGYVDVVDASIIQRVSTGLNTNIILS